jgi:zinc transporter, ZIP family
VIGFFIAGVVAIQVIGDILHRFAPSHVVDCDHSHDNEEGYDNHTSDHLHDENGHHIKPHHAEHEHNHLHGNAHFHHKAHQDVALEVPDETTALLPKSSESQIEERQGSSYNNEQRRVSFAEERRAPDMADLRTPGSSRRTSIIPQLKTRLSSLVTGSRPLCDDGGPCHGFSEPCSQQCFNHVAKKGTPSRISAGHTARQFPGIRRTVTDSTIRSIPEDSEHYLDNGQVRGGPEEYFPSSAETIQASSGERSRSLSPGQPSSTKNSASSNHDEENLLSTQVNGHKASNTLGRHSHKHSHSPTADADYHHHHVPTNEFMSIGLQTSIAIALHKLPEGFITFATNHANPKLGFTVFMALFIHNVTEGFAMALPLYLGTFSLPLTHCAHCHW